MQAIIVLPGIIPDLCGLDERVPGVLMPLVDRPFLQHIIEHLAANSVREFDIVLSHLPDKTEAYFGDGTRWGCRFRYHLAGDSNRPYRPIQTAIRANVHDSVVVAHADRYPMIPLTQHQHSEQIMAFAGEDDAWSGVAIFPNGKVPQEWFSAGRELLELSLRANSVWHTSELRGISIVEPEQFLKNQGQLLAGGFPELMIGGTAIETGIWMSRNVVIHPSARIVAPVFMGENTRVGKSTQIGPNAVLSRNCIIDSHTTIHDSLVMPGTYVGEGLELDTGIVDRNLLLNARVGASVVLSEEFILGGLTQRQRRSISSRWFNALVAAILLLALLPLFLVAALIFLITGTARLKGTRCVRIPVPEGSGNWRTFTIFQLVDDSGQLVPTGGWNGFLRSFIPGLVAVIGGNLSLTGFPPRTVEQVRALPEDWQKLYLSGCAGLVTEASATLIGVPEDEQLFLTEAYYSAVKTRKYDFGLFWRYFGNLSAVHHSSLRAAAKTEID